MIFNLGIRLIISPLCATCATWATVNPRAKPAFIRFGSVAIFNKWLWMDAKAHLVHTAKVGHVSIYCPSCPANSFFAAYNRGSSPARSLTANQKNTLLLPPKLDKYFQSIDTTQMATDPGILLSYDGQRFQSV
ncbi:hypothetical protein [Desulfotignum balticum]|uniref:hypothetical protein n=1 Tax=Desulfotignum balticum TaxID=115781 RepID=UPI0004625D42|nr:hypothetical protein [Desulfotignum balticum]